MENHIFYTEIRNQLVAELFNSPADLLRIKRITTLENTEVSHFSICSEAARVYYAVQDLSGVKNVNQTKALSYYAKQVFEQFIRQKALSNIDIIFIASDTIKRFS